MSVTRWSIKSLVFLPHCVEGEYWRLGLSANGKLVADKEARGSAEPLFVVAAISKVRTGACRVIGRRAAARDAAALLKTRPPVPTYLRIDTNRVRADARIRP